MLWLLGFRARIEWGNHGPESAGQWLASNWFCLNVPENAWSLPQAPGKAWFCLKCLIRPNAQKPKNQETYVPLNESKPGTSHPSAKATWESGVFSGPAANALPNIPVANPPPEFPTPPEPSHECDFVRMECACHTCWKCIALCATVAKESNYRARLLLHGEVNNASWRRIFMNFLTCMFRNLLYRANGCGGFGSQTAADPLWWPSQSPWKADRGYCDSISQNANPASTFELSQCQPCKEGLPGPRRGFGMPSGNLFPKTAASICTL